MRAPRVSIIILNWNGWKDTIECLESVYRITYPNYDVIVVDNGSQDDSVQKIKEYAEGKIRVNSKFFEYNPENKPIKVFEVSEEDAKRGRFNKPLYEKYDVDRRMILIKNKKNYGFAGGNNVGIKFALSVLNPDYVLLLNNDVIVDRDFLNTMLSVCKKNDKIGIVGLKSYTYRTNKLRRLPKAIGVLEPNVIETEYVEGSCFLIKSDVLRDVGLFDTRYFLYYEETDLCARARREGYRVVFVLNSRIWHKVGASRPSTTFIYFITRNWFLFVQKNYSKTRLILSFGYYMTITVPRRVYTYLIKHRSREEFKSFLRGFLEGLRFFGF
ncbi:glycosyltransferase family 2 protein [Thermococcus sibiricus]|uniref:Glycosyltransferase n=1 Tax=Thermococcus sibiricus TaxID=172049 RepID=A0A101EKW7_9EURY|nr:glycosyltransferase family 2 protein [Thermococcus sibiricus]KUK17262.1 MAG: Glycosyltransferase [Thermococcus sibiricus]